MKQLEQRLTIGSCERKNTSVYGNPSYWVYFDNGLAGSTAANAACGYSCTNYIGQEVNIKYHVTKNGNMVIDFIRS